MYSSRVLDWYADVSAESLATKMNVAAVDVQGGLLWAGHQVRRQQVFLGGGGERGGHMQMRGEVVGEGGGGRAEEGGGGRERAG